MYYIYKYVQFVLSAKFHKNQVYTAILRSNLSTFLISGQDLEFQISYLWSTNLTCSECQISWHWEYSSFLWPNFPGMKGLILVLMSNVCHLAKILIFLVVTACYLVVTGGYCSLLMVTARYGSLLLAPTFSMNVNKLRIDSTSISYSLFIIENCYR